MRHQVLGQNQDLIELLINKHGGNIQQACEQSWFMWQTKVKINLFSLHNTRVVCLTTQTSVPCLCYFPPSFSYRFTNLVKQLWLEGLFLLLYSVIYLFFKCSFKTNARKFMKSLPVFEYIFHLPFNEVVQQTVL